MLAGGGARGAYEMGVLSMLAPVLEEQGERVEIIVGTSAGGLNAAYLAANAHLPLSEAAAGGMEVWRGLRYRHAMRSLLSPASLSRLVHFFATCLGLPVRRVASLLDTAPLRKTLNRLIDFERIADNVADQASPLRSVSVVATSYETGRSIVFHHGGDTPPANEERAIDYVATHLDEAHVRASAAIPVIFPGVEVTGPSSWWGWYGDGGARLNAPLNPALALGAERVIVIGLNSSVAAKDLSVTTRPDLFDGASSLLSVLADQLTADVATLTTINEAVEHGNEGAGSRIPYIFVVPSDRLKIGRIAIDVYQRHYKSIRAILRSPNLALLGRITDAARNPRHGELYSYLFLAREFMDELIELGRTDAQRWLDSEHDEWPWRLGRPTET
ncbi:MAG: patatin-like phospholipase family protein [Solirubrobacteraceae bacterium MAG38_C4-C5]|nr:patatin-like phospholipase family protein [Candidatus Siliceabacter maunaloa]